MKVLKEVKTQLKNSIQLIGSNDTQNPSLIIGVMHGDEPQGKYLIEEYLKFSNNLENRNILFIPCLNPDGISKNTRTNSNNVDINRNFPTKNWGLNQGKNATCNDRTTNYYGGKAPASEIETKFIIDIINQYTPSNILTLHAPYKVVNYDGPARHLAEQISNIINYPVEESIGYPTPGSFGTYCGIERQIPVITLELDENCPIENLKKTVFEIFNLF